LKYFAHAQIKLTGNSLSFIANLLSLWLTDFVVLNFHAKISQGNDLEMAIDTFPLRKKYADITQCHFNNFKRIQLLTLIVSLFLVTLSLLKLFSAI